MKIPALLSRVARALTVRGGEPSSGIGNATMEGCIPITWPLNWWQQGRTPGLSGEPAIKQACIDAYAQTIASMELLHVKENDKGGHDVIENSAVAKLLRKPNSYQTRSDFVLNLIWNLFDNGNAYAVLERSTQTPVGMHLTNTRQTTPYVDAQTRSIFYALGGNPLVPEGIQYLVPQRDVLHVRLHCPLHPLVGVSPITAAALAMAANVAITAQQAAFFSQMARPSGVLSTEATLTRNQIEMLRAAWEAQSVGLNAGGVPILSNGLKWFPLGISSQDSEIAAAFNMTVEDVARAFRVPLPLVGSMQGATYNNVEQLIGLWMSTGLGFVLEHVESALAATLEISTPGESIEFDTDSLQRIDFKGRVEALTKGISGGLYSPNEAREREGLPRVAFGDEPRLQAQVVPLSRIDAAPATPAPSATPAGTDALEPDADAQDAAKNEAKSYLLKVAANG
jgi:HK97 family phage portal protein